MVSGEKEGGGEWLGEDGKDMRGKNGGGAEQGNGWRRT